MKAHFEMFAAYNRWANARLYEAFGELPAEEWGRDVGAFFTSLSGTMNHILVADRIWMKRFTGTGAAPTALDTVLFEDLEALKTAREAEDARISGWLSEIGQEALAGTFTYVTVTDRREVTQKLSPALAHFFNHQTHHRGQAHGILSQLGRTPPSLDLVRFQRDEPRWLG